MNIDDIHICVPTYIIIYSILIYYSCNMYYITEPPPWYPYVCYAMLSTIRRYILHCNRFNHLKKHNIHLTFLLLKNYYYHCNLKK